MIGFYYRNCFYEKLVVPYVMCVQPSGRCCVVDVTPNGIAKEVLDLRKRKSELIRSVKKEEIKGFYISDRFITDFNIDVHTKNLYGIARRGKNLFDAIRSV